ncbi:MAG: RloB family protein [Vampirovibrionales bacterium]|jgi:hypothetical protein
MSGRNNRQDFRRVKKPAKPLLCLTEGKETEMLYLKHTLKTQSKTITSKFKQGSQIIQYAIEKYKGEYKIIYAIFDREFPSAEEHRTLREIDEILKKDQGTVIPIMSSPCIEYVLLLHFVDKHPIFNNNKEVERALKKECPSYQKNETSFFQSLTKQQIQEASERLKKRDTELDFTEDSPIKQRADKDHMPNSNFYVLIDALTVNKT